MAHVPQDVLDRIRALETEVRQLRGRAQIRPALNQILNGKVKIGEGGQLSVEPPGGGEAVFAVGALPTTYDADEFGTVLRRADGSIALLVWNGASPDEPQVLRIYDAAGNEIVSEDITAGGLYKPWLPYPTPQAEEVADWPSTTSTAWTVLQRSRAMIQHPRIKARADKSGTGQLRICVNGTPALTGASDANLNGTGEIPSYTYGMDADITLEARVTGGGTLWAMTRYVYGVGSA